MLNTVSFTADGTKQLATIHRRRDALQYIATILAYGTGGSNWGSGTLSYLLSPDGGTTKIPIKDLTGTALASTADDNINVSFGNPSSNLNNLTIWVTLSGSTTPSLTVDLFDNR